MIWNKKFNLFGNTIEEPEEETPEEAPEETAAMDPLPESAPEETAAMDPLPESAPEEEPLKRKSRGFSNPFAKLFSRKKKSEEASGEADLETEEEAPEEEALDESAPEIPEEETEETFEEAASEEADTLQTESTEIPEEEPRAYLLQDPFLAETLDFFYETEQKKAIDKALFSPKEEVPEEEEETTYIRSAAGGIIRIRRSEQTPFKTRMNFVRAMSPCRNAGRIIGIIAATAACAFVLIKFGILDRYEALEKDAAELKNLQARLESGYVELYSAEGMAEEYAHTTWSGMSEEEMEQIRREAVTDLVTFIAEHNVAVQGVVLLEQELMVSITADDLSVISDLTAELREQEIVSSCSVATAQTVLDDVNMSETPPVQKVEVDDTAMPSVEESEEEESPEETEEEPEEEADEEFSPYEYAEEESDPASYGESGRVEATITILLKDRSELDGEISDLNEDGEYDFYSEDDGYDTFEESPVESESVEDEIFEEEESEEETEEIWDEEEPEETEEEEFDPETDEDYV